MIVVNLNRRLPQRYVARPGVHFGSSMEIDVATYEEDDADYASRPTLALATDFPDMDVYEVRVYDTKSGRRLVAAVEIVSPSNKDRPEHRRAFVAKCADMLRDGVFVAIVNLVTTRHFNLYGDLMDFVGQADPSLGDEPPPIYAVASRWGRQGGRGLLESWMYRLELGRPLPTLPLWLAENFAVPLELEPTYEETRRALRIP